MQISDFLPNYHLHQSNKLLLHSCCAPCMGPLVETILSHDIQLTILFYNPNIHPKKEYELRKNENIRFSEKMRVPFVDLDYDVQDWFVRAKGMEREPERGVRCSMCFEMRFYRTALYAFENDFNVITSSLGISRWKNMLQVNEAGQKAVSYYPNLYYSTYNWRKGGGASRMYEIAKKENFYKQEYCGCIYSLRDTNEWRREKGREEIEIGCEFYR
ncbi:Epoxyqueuosine reductase QueH [Rickettsiales endosymbiont of Paramecium tredecaurelia]|uniref:epoxyqueuosine reductase QueH n=1 Tax=Candidatus Sarmatiella mevalonica TaxID=2770581 RepID=UPI00192043BA|nr:epoxyqueuosine reductase QueH [Candidatus Sarmatiella mevalonica]MBL3284750.1 Epoxyqueuosine reductase QueH [Candidatus Sarmatiella mevalonica]